jgi:hypothetical protein
MWSIIDDIPSDPYTFLIIFDVGISYLKAIHNSFVVNHNDLTQENWNSRRASASKYQKSSKGKKTRKRIISKIVKKSPVSNIKISKKINENKKKNYESQKKFYIKNGKKILSKKKYGHQNVSKKQRESRRESVRLYQIKNRKEILAKKRQRYNMKKKS